MLAAAAVISLVDGSDVLGIFAANGTTTLVWAAAAGLLILLALLPRVGGDKGSRDGGQAPRRDRTLEDRGADEARRVDAQRAERHRRAGASVGSRTENGDRTGSSSL